jgi:hypothetical protein
MRSCHRHRSQGHDGEIAKKDVINCVDICHFLWPALTQQFLFQAEQSSAYESQSHYHAQAKADDAELVACALSQTSKWITDEGQTLAVIGLAVTATETAPTEAARCLEENETNNARNHEPDFPVRL